MKSPNELQEGFDLCRESFWENKYESVDTSEEYGGCLCNVQLNRCAQLYVHLDRCGDLGVRELSTSYLRLNTMLSEHR
jgi:hypothetical protein